VLAASPSPPSAAPSPACVDRPPAAEDGPFPPSVEPAPASPAPHVQPSLFPVAAASRSEEKDHTRAKRRINI